MFDSLNIVERKALASIGLRILGIKYDGRIRTNEPDIYNLFVDFFYAETQEEIMPILQELINIDQSSATEIASSLSNLEKDNFRRYLVDRSNNNAKMMIAIAFFMKNIGFNNSYFSNTDR